MGRPRKNPNTGMVVAREAVVVTVGARAPTYEQVEVTDRRTGNRVMINKDQPSDPGSEGIPYAFRPYQRVADLPPGTAINVAGGSQATIHEVLGLVAQHTGVVPAIDFAPPQPGDVRATGGSIDRAERLLGWTPRTSLSDGIAAV